MKVSMQFPPIWLVKSPFSITFSYVEKTSKALSILSKKSSIDLFETANDKAYITTIYIF